VSRLGFEPRTRGLKVPAEAVHGVIWGPLLSTLRVDAIHRLHQMPPSAFPVAGSVAGRSLPCSDTDRVRHPLPRVVLDALEPAQVGRRHRQARVVKESADGLD